MPEPVPHPLLNQLKAWAASHPAVAAALLRNLKPILKPGQVTIALAGATSIA